MFVGKKIVSLTLAGGLALAPVGASANDIGKLIGGAIIGGAIFCGATGKCTNKQQSSGSSAPRSSGVSSAQRAENKSVQEALNAFGFNVGTPDGALGPKSRAGISNFQAYMGYEPTGYLNDYQKNQLLESHQRMNAGGGQAYPQVVATEGTKGLLRAFNDPNYPPRNTQVAPPQQYAMPQPPVVAPPPVAVPPAPAPVLPPVAQAAPVLPQLSLPGAAKPLSTSMAERCEVVDLMTQTNQGPMQISNLTDPDQALSEQFCAARSFAILDGQSTGEQYALTADKVEEACGWVTESMKPVAAKLGSADPATIVTDAKAAGSALSGGDSNTAAIYGRVCAGHGYRSDDAEAALGGVLMMVGSGAAPYGEMLGHHVREGFGAVANDGTAAQWYGFAMDALDQGQAPAFLPTTSAERVRIIRQAISMGALQASLQPQPALPALVHPAALTLPQ